MSIEEGGRTMVERDVKATGHCAKTPGRRTRQLKRQGKQWAGKKMVMINKDEVRRGENMETKGSSAADDDTNPPAEIPFRQTKPGCKRGMQAEFWRKIRKKENGG